MIILQSAFEAIFGWLGDILAVLNSTMIDAFGVSVSFLVIIGAFIVLNMVIGLFWRGAKG